MYKTPVIYFIIVLVCLFSESYANHSEESKLYEKTVTLFKRKKYKQSIRISQKIADLYPLSYLAMKAQLLSSNASYKIGDYSAAASSADSYISIYSNSEDLSHAYYVRLLSYYKQLNKVQLEQGTAHKTLELATEYINLFPDSKYINDVKKKIKLVTRHILAKEYSIGQFYFNRGEYLAAIKRFLNILDRENSEYHIKAINCLITAHLALGLDLEAEHYKSMLASEANKQSS